MRRLGRNVAWGASIGFGSGAIFCLIVLLERLVRGPHFLDAYGIGFGTLLACYLAGGTGAGLVVGLARPLLRWWAGAIVVGIFAGLVAAGALGLGMSGPIRTWGADAWTAVLIMGVVGGGWLGYSNWEDTVELALPDPELPAEPPAPRPPLGLWRPR